MVCLFQTEGHGRWYKGGGIRGVVREAAESGGKRPLRKAEQSRGGADSP